MIRLGGNIQSPAKISSHGWLFRHPTSRRFLRSTNEHKFDDVKVRHILGSALCNTRIGKFWRHSCSIFSSSFTDKTERQVVIPVCEFAKMQERDREVDEEKDKDVGSSREHVPGDCSRGLEHADWPRNDRGRSTVSTLFHFNYFRARVIAKFSAISFSTESRCSSD